MNFNNRATRNEIRYENTNVNDTSFFLYIDSSFYEEFFWISLYIHTRVTRVCMRGKQGSWSLSFHSCRYTRILCFYTEALWPVIKFASCLDKQKRAWRAERFKETDKVDFPCDTLYRFLETIRREFDRENSYEDSSKSLEMFRFVKVKVAWYDSLYERMKEKKYFIFRIPWIRNNLKLTACY